MCSLLFFVSGGWAVTDALKGSLARGGFQPGAICLWIVIGSAGGFLELPWDSSTDAKRARERRLLWWRNPPTVEEPQAARSVGGGGLVGVSVLGGSCCPDGYTCLVRWFHTRHVNASS